MRLLYRETSNITVNMVIGEAEQGYSSYDLIENADDDYFSDEEQYESPLA
jgi:hypothetical protein